MTTAYTQSTHGLPDIARRLLESDGPVLVLTHAKPDGDAFGSVVALVAALQAAGKTARGVFVPPVPRALTLQKGADLADLYGDAYTPPFDPALCVIVDTGAWTQVGPLRRFVEPWLDRTIILDHHLSGDIAASARHVQGEAAAACEIVAELVELLLPGMGEGAREVGRREGDASGFKSLPPVIREALFIGIASDTGWFRFSNTRPQTLELAAKLIRQGVDHADLYQKLEQAERPAKLALLTRALQSLTLHGRGRAAVMVLRAADFEETGALPDETERLIDTPQMVGGLEVIVLLTESATPDGRPLTRMSFRSKHAADDTAINVADLAARFGGGGHARAAGAKQERPIDPVLADLTAALDRL